MPTEIRLEGSETLVHSHARDLVLHEDDTFTIITVGGTETEYKVETKTVVYNEQIIDEKVYLNSYFPVTYIYYVSAIP